MDDSNKNRNIAQERFDAIYITSAEVAKSLNITRSALHFARQRGVLPPAIELNRKIVIWERSTLVPYLEQWKISINSKKPWMALIK